MNTSIFRTLRKLLHVCPLGLAASAALAAGSYSPEERKLVERLPQFFEAKCVEGALKEQQRQSPEEQRALKGWAEAVSGPNGVCACASAEIMKHITPEFLRRPDIGQQMNAIAMEAGATCTASRLRTWFPEVCPSMMHQRLAQDDKTRNYDPYIPGMCQCMSARMGALSVSDLKPYMQALMAPANVGRSATEVAIQTLPHSFEDDMRECGMAAANRMVEAETRDAIVKAAEAAGITQDLEPKR